MRKSPYAPALPESGRTDCQHQTVLSSTAFGILAAFFSTITFIVHVIFNVALDIFSLVIGDEALLMTYSLAWLAGLLGSMAMMVFGRTQLRRLVAFASAIPNILIAVFVILYCVFYALRAIGGV